LRVSPATPSDHIALPQNGEFSRSYTAIPGPDGRLHANGGEIGRTPPSPFPDSDPPNAIKNSITPTTLQLSRALAMNGKNRAFAIPAMPPRFVCGFVCEWKFYFLGNESLLNPGETDFYFFSSPPPSSQE